MAATRMTQEQFDELVKRNGRTVAKRPERPSLEIVGSREVRPARKKPRKLEEELQILCTEWFDRQHPALSPILFAIPNSLSVMGKDKAAIGAWFHKMRRLKRMGLRDGVLDQFLAEPRGGFHGLWLELKVGKNVMSLAQKVFKFMVEARGYRVEEIRTLEDYQSAVTSYLSEAA